CYRYEAAFREEVLVALLLVPLGIWLGESGAERALLVGSWLLVLMMELLNSAVEAVVDRVGEEHNELSGRAKDIASAAVLLAIGVAILTWALILLPRLMAT
ncbi:MAG: diacylglycerol kinase, partial [Sedimenticolaceae bacterium]